MRVKAVFPDVSDITKHKLIRGNLYVVRFLNPTANKPLHLGHLRNIAIGDATAGSMRALGFAAVRHCVVEDSGRWMSEAMAAYSELVRNGGLEPAAARYPKSDHFIGAIYAEHRRRLKAQQQQQAVPAGPAYDARDDVADELQRALMRGDEAARHLRDEVKARALTGQEATLRRLGVSFDHCDYESAEDTRLEDFVDEGLERGLFRRTEGGEVLFRTGAGATLRMTNRLGLHEESARLLSFLRNLLAGWDSNRINVIIAGSEWKGWMDIYPEVLEGFGVRHARAMYCHAFYGMVRLNGRKMASSAGPGVLVDDLLADLAATRRVRAVAGAATNDGSTAAIAASVVKSYLLSAPRVEPIDFERGRLEDPGSNPGWAIVAAWQLARAAADLGEPSSRAAGILGAGLELFSFEAPLKEAARLARRLIASDATSADRADFVFLVRALGLAPELSEFAYQEAPPLLDGAVTPPELVTPGFRVETATSGQVAPSAELAGPSGPASAAIDGAKPHIAVIRDDYLRVLRRHMADPSTPVSVDADFWTLGIDSLNALNLLLDLEESFDVSFPGSLLTVELFSSVGALEGALLSILPEQR